jgi:hypothetical protein
LVKRTLEPRETIRLGYAWFVVGLSGVGELTYPVLFAIWPGKYRVRCSGFPLRLNDNKSFDSRWATGQLDMDIKEPR